MSTPTLSEILNPPTTATALDSIVLPELKQARDGVRLPVTNWKPGGVFRSLAYGIARLYSEATTRAAAWCAANFGDYVGGLVATPTGADVTSFVADWALDRAGIARIAATYTTRTILLTNSLATARNVTAGNLVIRFTATGNRYVNSEAYVSAGSDAVEVLFRSEYTVDSADSARQYLDASGATIEIVTSIFPGVTATNPAALYSDVTQIGGGSGTITPSSTPDGVHTAAIRIDTGGAANVAAGAWSYSIDGGAFLSVGTLDDATDQLGYAVDLTFAGTFVAGTTYYFSWPGSDVVTVGRDEETPAELVARARGLQPALAFPKDGAGNWIPTSPTISAYEALARSASDQVKVCLVRTDGTINNKVHVVVAGQGSTLSVATIALLQAFFDSWTMLTDRVTVANASTTTINLAGATVKVKQSQLTQAQEAAQTAVAAYLGGIDTANPLGPAGLIDRSYIMALIRQSPGVTHMNDSLTIEGAATDYQLATDTIAVWNESLATVLTWVTV